MSISIHIPVMYVPCCAIPYLQAFEAYDQAGDKRAVVCLKYMMLCKVRICIRTHMNKYMCTCIHSYKRIRIHSFLNSYTFKTYILTHAEHSCTYIRTHTNILTPSDASMKSHTLHASLLAYMHDHLTSRTISTPPFRRIYSLKSLFSSIFSF